MRELATILSHDAKAGSFTVGPGAATLTEAVVRAALHQKGEMVVGPRTKLWCVCGWRWEGESGAAARQAWDEHLRG